ncbi:TPA: restriction endonuclease subunit S [Klebsiella pneumoniae]|uniref:restriction endonuclease subunit S n=1 Tax=Klebsiella pneumoniae TaxID=573 RepID=UPI00226E356E|nr:restriction endonuclease subunit S [Klebsiella pneumoniae]MCY0505950.1 restriction endonuclease subunit S [Klebsiella pneumoniae]HBT3891649.1 restriction endonuclease subunit S [Klebsiella pneumoniae]
MSFEFSKVSLKQISSKIGDGIHGTPIYDENGSYYFINGNNLGSGRIVITSSTKKVGRNEYLKHKKELNESTVLLSINGTIGNVALYDDEPVILGKSACYINILPDVSVRYIGYVLKDRPFQHYIKQQANGSTIKNVSLKLIRDYEFTLPPKVVQDRIAEILSSLDKKISVNENMNIILEQMAQALFKSWFVDFEPVKAKMTVLEAGGSQEDATLAAMTAISGKDTDALEVFEREHPEQYAELKTTAELFPSAMQDSELGEIPEGWSIKPLDGIATYQNGLALQKFRPENENDFLPVVKIAQLKKGFSDGEEKASPNIKPECIIDNGDVVFSWSGSLMVDIWCGGKAALNQHLFKVSSTKYPKWLYYKYTAHHLIEFQRIAEAKAVTMGHIKREHLSQAKCLMPSSETVHAFTPFFEPVLNKVISNRLETRKLENIRDTLLPKLLSGEITLPEAEQAVSEVENV